MRGLRLFAAAVLVAFAACSAWAQPLGKVFRVAYLSPNARDASTSIAALAEFRRVLGELGYVEGRNLVIESRWAEGKTERLGALVDELAAGKPDVFVTLTTQPTLAARDVAGTRPVVFVNVTDPVGAGLAASLQRPGGNVTGVSDFGIELASKSIDVLREMLPAATRVAVLTSDNPVHRYQLHAILVAATRHSIEIQPVPALGSEELEAAIQRARRSAHALVILGGGVQSGNRARIADLALSAGLPTFAYVRPYVEAGALASYGHKILPQYRVAAVYVGKILGGTHPGDIPIAQPAEFEWVVNLKTARALGVAIPPAILSRADEVIQ